ncbi:MAG: LuxR C-terminal-related transcriptional regulator [Clostridiaceae bacterium]|nr:LuxR C-terminal-related transcriptional regulator [Clostridiaceae bacterium]
MYDINNTEKAEYQPMIIGRESELAILQERLLQNEVRLLTLTGAAGVGKTRLALTLLSHVRPLFTQSIYVDLTPLKKPDQVIPAIARAYNVKEVSPGLLTQRLAEAIGVSQLLLVLDNCEHVLKAKPEIDFLLSNCPNLKILATSREISKLKWEWVFPVIPLKVPNLETRPELSVLSKVPSVDLFVQQAQNRNHDFVLTEENALLVANLCVRMDGLPLAIILAASQGGSLKPIEDLKSLNVRLGLVKPVTRNAYFRHSTLQTALDWSYTLLETAEKTLFNRLSVFQGSWTLQEAVGICSGDRLKSKEIPSLLDHLVDASLVQMDKRAGKGKIYRFLETVRVYARMKLRDSKEEELMQRQHRDWFLVWAEQVEFSIWGPEAPEWLEQIEMNYENIRSAMEWCRDTSQEAQSGLRLWAAVVSFYDLKGHVTEGITLAKQLLILAPDLTVERARTLLQASVLFRSQGELAGARLLVEECLAFSAGLGDVFDSICALCTLGSLEHIQGNFEKSKESLIKACALSRMHFEHEPRVLYISLFWLGVYYCFQGQNDQAVTHLEEALTVARQQGCILFESRILAVMGRALVGKGDFGRAKTILIEGIYAAKKLKYYEIIALCFEYLGQAAWLQRKKERANRLLGAAAALRTYVGVIYWFPDSNYSLISTELGSEVQARHAPADNMLPEQITEWALAAIEPQINTSETQSFSIDSTEILTLREMEITRLITQGFSNRRIAEQLVISRRTVDAHVQHILGKLDINTRAQISAWYTQHNNSRKQRS